MASCVPDYPAPKYFSNQTTSLNIIIKSKDFIVPLSWPAICIPLTALTPRWNSFQTLPVAHHRVSIDQSIPFRL